MDAGVTAEALAQSMMEQTANGSLTWPQAFTMTVFFICCAYVASVFIKRL